MELATSQSTMALVTTMAPAPMALATMELVAAMAFQLGEGVQVEAGRTAAGASTSWGVSDLMCM